MQSVQIFKGTIRWHSATRLLTFFQQINFHSPLHDLTITTKNAVTKNNFSDLFVTILNGLDLVNGCVNGTEQGLFLTFNVNEVEQV